MKTRQVIALLIGTVSTLVLFARLLSPPALALAIEPSTSELSSYLEDSDFLLKFAKHHRHALTMGGLIAPEIQLLLTAQPPAH